MDCDIRKNRLNWYFSSPKLIKLFYMSGPESSEGLRQDFIELFDVLLFISGPLPAVNRGINRFGRILKLNTRLSKAWRGSTAWMTLIHSGDVCVFFQSKLAPPKQIWSSGSTFLDTQQPGLRRRSLTHSSLGVSAMPGSSRSTRKNKTPQSLWQSVCMLITSSWMSLPLPPPFAPPLPQLFWDSLTKWKSCFPLVFLCFQYIM